MVLCSSRLFDGLWPSLHDETESTYDPLPNEAGSFMNEHGNHQHPHYHGPHRNKQARIDAGCADDDAPTWFTEHFCS